MANETPETKQEGSLISCSRRSAAHEVDCSTWGEVEPQSEGPFALEHSVRPAIEIDCSSWVPVNPIALVLSLKLDPTIDWMAPTLDVVRRLDEAEQALEGGAGLEWDRLRSATVGQGKVVVTLTPRNREGAEVRLADLVEWAKKAIPEFAGARLAA